MQWDHMSVAPVACIELNDEVGDALVTITRTIQDASPQAIGFVLPLGSVDIESMVASLIEWHVVGLVHRYALEIPGHSCDLVNKIIELLMQASAFESEDEAARGNFFVVKEGDSNADDYVSCLRAMQSQDLVRTDIDVSYLSTWQLTAKWLLHVEVLRRARRQGYRTS